LRSQTNLRWLYLSASDVTGEVPAWLGSLANLEQLRLSYNWGLSGPLPSGLRRAGLEGLDILVTQACAPASTALQSFPVATTTASIPFRMPLLCVAARYGSAKPDP